MEPPPNKQFRSYRALFGLLSAGITVLSFTATEEAKGQASPSETSPTASRIYADGFLAWIYKHPKRDPAPIGVLRAGQSVSLRSEGQFAAGEPVKKGCGRGWFAVEPAGYICLDRRASLKPTRYSRSMAQLLPKPGAYPFEFALSMGTPSYRRIPLPQEWERKERRFGAAQRRELPPHWRGHEELATNPPLPVRDAFDFLREGSSVARSPENRLVRRDVPFGSMLALTGTFESEGRVFGQSADGTLVPMDRMVAFKHSEFEGVELGQPGGYQLPLAWPKKPTRFYDVVESSSCAARLAPPRNPSNGTLAPHATKLDQVCLVVRSDVAPPRKPLELSGRSIEIAGTRFVELANQNAWLPYGYLHLAERRAVPRRVDIEADERWIDFSISDGTLTSYEGTKALFSTLASPGIGGVPVRGADPLSTRTTPVGTYRITFKYRSDDMSPEHGEHRKFWIADVPFTLYFNQPFAIHVAYWHESFGQPMSGGCINVSPRDGARLFEWTSPHVPEDWYGAGPAPELGRGTLVRIRR